MNKISKFSNWLRNSITARMIVVGFLLLILLIPLSFVQDLIRERSYRQIEVTKDINNKWGKEVILQGPYLRIPYKTYTTTKTFNKETDKYETETHENLNHAFFFPEELNINSQVEADKLNRGIYESIVFTSDIELDGNFKDFDFSKREIKAENILWEKAQILVKTSNLKGIKNSLAINLNGTSYDLTPQYNNESLSTLVTDYIVLPNEMKDPIAFDIKTKINGSERLTFIPIGKETKATMTSNWHSPSFSGTFLPEKDSKKITPEGFKAQWNISQINRQFEQSFFNGVPDLRSFAFGADLYIPVDEYQKSERSSKYGFMVIGLTLLVFLLIQIVSKIYIHPFQYVMIGLALVMFYTLLISISEHSTFFKAYIIAAIAVLGLITIYSRAILKGLKFPLLVCTSLAALYGFIYVIIQLENYALLVGSIGLFMILAIIMFASRKIDWSREN
jgi:inner membrane protein